MGTYCTRFQKQYWMNTNHQIVARFKISHQLHALKLEATGRMIRINNVTMPYFDLVLRDMNSWIKLTFCSVLAFLKYADTYLTELLTVLQPYLYGNGGPIILVQVSKFINIISISLSLFYVLWFRYSFINIPWNSVCYFFWQNKTYGEKILLLYLNLITVN